MCSIKQYLEVKLPAVVERPSRHHLTLVGLWTNVLKCGRQSVVHSGEKSRAGTAAKCPLPFPANSVYTYTVVL